MNILILSAGTRCQLVKYFKERDNGFDKVVTTDSSIYAPAIYMSDVHYIVPEMWTRDYLPVLLNICKKERIHVLLPLHEDELELISKNRELFEEKGIFAAVSDIEVVKTCRDKYLLYKKLAARDINCVETYDYDTELDFINDMRLPVMAKERNGTGSLGALKIDSWPLLLYFAESKNEKLIVQPYLEAEEYGVDAFADFISGEAVAVFAKQKIRMRAGETEKSKSFKDEGLFEFVKNVIHVMNLRGPVDFDIFKMNGKFYVLEINPRFGGGYPHAYECGVNFISFLAKNARGETNHSVIGQYYENEVLLKYTEAMLKNEKDML